MERSMIERVGTDEFKFANARAMMRRAGVIADCVALGLATFAAIALRGAVAPWLGLRSVPFGVDWTLAVPFLTIIGAYAGSGLYEREAYVSRPLHAWTIAKASTAAFIVTDAAAFLIGTGWWNVPRLTLVLTFGFFPLIDVPLRLGALHRMYEYWTEGRRPVAYVVGDSPESHRIATRLASLRGFARVRSIDDEGPTRSWPDALVWDMDHRSAEELTADSVFIDSGSLTPREAMGVIEAAQDRGVDVYVASGLLGPLEGGRLLKTLFQTPVTRVRRKLASPPGYVLKRALDVIGSSVALVLLSPVIALLAVLIKLTSPGPVFLTQTRVGLSGRTFGFLKFRSMYADSDSSAHERYVQALISGDAQPTATDPEGNGIFHIVDDPRVTPVGRFIRKYSLDEIPQLVNVVRGDMSLVGPRPPLPYEAAAYDSWQRQRLEVQSGITGVWQVVGRNRVSFDEMTFQDLMYGMNTGLMVDLKLCLKTIPAALIGSGL
jgi:exopolysaccharide biosynthesis polyprenyl glycosylphosphotransferase